MAGTFFEHLSVEVGNCWVQIPCLENIARWDKNFRRLVATRLLKLDALLSADAGVEGMFDFTHLSDEIGGFD